MTPKVKPQAQLKPGTQCCSQETMHPCLSSLLFPGFLCGQSLPGGSISIAQDSAWNLVHLAPAAPASLSTSFANAVEDLSPSRCSVKSTRIDSEACNEDHSSTPSQLQA